MSRKTRNEIAELRRKIAESERAASTDSVTQVLGQDVVKDKVREAVVRALKDHQPLSLVLADIDDFKRINDTYSYETGDEVLKQFAQILKENIGGGELLLRGSGDQFLIIVPGTPGVNGRLFADRLRKAIKDQQFQLGSLAQTVSLTMSAGVTELLHERDKRDTIEQTIDVLTNRLHGALDRAKGAKDTVILIA